MKHFSPSPCNIERCQMINLKQELFLDWGQCRLALTPTKNISRSDPSIEADVKFSMFIAHHITLFNLLDNLDRIIRQEFRDSRAWKVYSCGRTKTSSIVNCIRVFEELKSAIQTLPLKLKKKNFHEATHVMCPWSFISLTSLYQLFFKPIRSFAVDINCYLDLISTGFMS